MTFISKKSCKDLVDEAAAQISFLSVEDLLALYESKEAEFVDLRVFRELQKTGVIPGAHSCPRGLLEFWLDQDSPFARDIFAKDAMFVFYCDNGWRSTLSTRLAAEMGLQNVHCLRGGLDAWIEARGPVTPYRW
ncbi:rhodanese-like domain-containing protein [Tritonibacter horizontis]|uniref:Molybdopterin biosynthesis protein MoeB n=1 Tax=Tritonibacter horizontis TaxID=1768241 RepID=A0A132BVD9_9RHOB|nr:rhodanese-like domain-containing protein [Tritonibacter horizontis]KUP92022.1 molybdopterin biosynthesis protein MoeB [Tritonibacter horizontis]